MLIKLLLPSWFLILLVGCERPVYAPDNDKQQMVLVRGGVITLGENALYPEERGRRTVSVESFYMSKTEVTNREFREFVEATGYVTTAEKVPSREDYPNLPESMRVAGAAVFNMPESVTGPVKSMSWWRFLHGAYWAAPRGIGSDLSGLDDYPVIHISYMDAESYAKWKGHRLPTEAEFELAAQGMQAFSQGRYLANTWQGAFPYSDDADDGFSGLAPVAQFPANKYGIYDLLGNVWEWTSSVYYHGHSVDNPLLEASNAGQDETLSDAPVRVVKGGSFLCSQNYCARFRPAARQAQDKGLGTSHIGFRTVKDIN
ncbi:formylglycine-generating enzyme family protein [Bowmanella denitrificans]|uniref:formylglycine-generating enzyme family protein n=1 Tax=Bowmanella denitrificans TaxID=366582 RepID=UPI000C9B098A|nr:formylglycine-generating enzyme family protein [Bowmanella denitrificans]